MKKESASHAYWGIGCHHRSIDENIATISDEERTRSIARCSNLRAIELDEADQLIKLNELLENYRPSETFLLLLLSLSNPIDVISKNVVLIEVLIRKYVELVLFV